MGDVPPQEGHGVGRIIFELFGPGVDFLLMKNAKPDACERINIYRGTSYAIQTRSNHYNYIDMEVFLHLQPLGNPILLLALVHMA